jgi:hypothetical protein
VAARAAPAIRRAQTDADEHAVAVAFGPIEGTFSPNLVYTLLDLGAYAEALRVSKHGVAQMRALGMPFLYWAALDALALAHLALLQGEAARQVGEEMLNVTRRLPLPYVIYNVNAHLCAACGLSGDWASAQVYAGHALASRLALGPVDQTHHHLTAALLRGGDVAHAREDVRRFGEEAGSNRRFRIPYLRSRALLARWDGATAQAVGHLEEALALATEIGLPGEQCQLAALLAQAYRDQGQTDQAEQARALAAVTLQALAAELPDPDLRASFLEAASRLSHLGCAPV